MGTVELGCLNPQGPPGGVLLSTTVVDGDKHGGFWAKAVNLSDENVMLFKNQKVGILTDIVDCSEPLKISSETDCPTVSYVSDNLHKGNLEDVAIDLSGSDLSGTQKGQLQNLLLSYNDVFSMGKRDIGKYSAGVQHHIPLKTRGYPS